MLSLHLFIRQTGEQFSKQGTIGTRDESEEQPLKRHSVPEIVARTRTGTNVRELVMVGASKRSTWDERRKSVAAQSEKCSPGEQLRVLSTPAKGMGKGTGFDEPFCRFRNTTLPHPSADLSEHASISAPDVTDSRVRHRHRVHIPGRLSSSKHISRGKILPGEIGYSTRLGPVAKHESAMSSALVGLYDDIVYADGSKETIMPKSGSALSDSSRGGSIVESVQETKSDTSADKIQKMTVALERTEETTIEKPVEKMEEKIVDEPEERIERTRVEEPGEKIRETMIEIPVQKIQEVKHRMNTARSNNSDWELDTSRALESVIMSPLTCHPVSNNWPSSPKRIHTQKFSSSTISESIMSPLSRHPVTPNWPNSPKAIDATKTPLSAVQALENSSNPNTAPTYPIIKPGGFKQVSAVNPHHMKKDSGFGISRFEFGSRNSSKLTLGTMNTTNRGSDSATIDSRNENASENGKKKKKKEKGLLRRLRNLSRA